MCDELGDEDTMNEYVMSAAGTSLCSATTGAGCGDKEKGFIAKWKEGKSAAEISAQLERLQSMATGSMKPDLMKWIKQRMAILKQLNKDEL